MTLAMQMMLNEFIDRDFSIDEMAAIFIALNEEDYKEADEILEGYGLDYTVDELI